MSSCLFSGVQVPEPRPGLCVNDSTTLPDQYYIFVGGHTLMDETVQPILGRPVLTQASESHRLTTIAVHTNATTPDGQSYDVLFMGTGQYSIYFPQRTFIKMKAPAEFF